ncbi:MAG: RNA-binding S4 domain-containing protein [Ideonella sp.]|nr:RNA-binding S4 domain-containing protein [Ideonella sp.]
MKQLDLTLRGDYIALDALLKATGLVESGGRARAVIAEGLVLVDNLLETRKTCKIRAGQKVMFDGHEVSVNA